MKFNLVIGAQKAGTTWLYNNLQENVFNSMALSIIKELNFFPEFYKLDNWYYAHRLSQINDHRTYLIEQETSAEEIESICKIYEREHVDISWYNEIFSKSHMKMAIDVSPEYAHMPPKIIRDIPSMIDVNSIIIIVRNPLDRAISHISMDVGRGNATVQELIDSKDVYDRSDYETIIGNWKEVFNDKVSVLDYRKISTHPEVFLEVALHKLGHTGPVNYNRCREIIHGSSSSKAKLTDEQISQLRKIFSRPLAYWKTLF